MLRSRFAAGRSGFPPGLRVLMLGLALTLAACDEDAEPPSGATGAQRKIADPAEAARSDEATAPRQAAPALDDAPEPPPRGCVEVQRLPLGTGLGPAALASRGDGVWIASYAQRSGTRRLARFHLSPGVDTARTLPELPLGPSDGKAAKSAPAVAAGAASLWIAATDSKGALSLWPQADAEAPEPVAIATRADRRFAPTLHAQGQGALLAWTEGDATGMRVRAARVEGSRVQRHDVTPLGHGAAAPGFVVGAEAPTLLMLDARSGMSPLLTVRFDASGQPATAEVERPVNLPYSPPSLAAVALDEKPVQVAYTAIGNAATAAVGVVALGTLGPPQALLRGTGYALLSVVGAAGGERAVFAMDAPRHGDADPPLEVHVRVWDGAEAGPALRVREEDGSTSRPALAFVAAGGLFALATLHGDSLELRWLRCDA